MASMRALWLEAGRAPRVCAVPRPAPAPGEVRVRVVRVGLCATDLALGAGYLDFVGVPGHEFVGVALEGPWRGQRVVGEINAGCGECERCLGGDSRHCAARTVLGILGRPGALAEELRLPAANLRPVPAAVTDDAALFCEPLAAALALLEVEPDPAGLRALVVGDGRLGLLCAAVLGAAGAEVEVLGRHPERQDWLAARARHLGRPLVAGEPPLHRYPLVVEASGRAASLAAVLPWVAPRGTLLLKTTTERPVTLDPTPLVVEELRVVGSRCGRFDTALEWLAAGRIDPRPLIRERHPLSAADVALERAALPGALKVVVDITAP
jgi:threonine dehydrogenase-like Zn-dependent dehydrogenase